MARIRSIKPEFWCSEQVVECSPHARLLFIAMWNFCDDSGIHSESVKRLKMQIFPSDDFTLADVAVMVDELVSAGLLERYSVADRSYLRVTGWHQHQRIDQPTYKYPLPEGVIPSKVRRNNTEDLPNVRHSFAERSLSVHPGKGKEGKGAKNSGQHAARFEDFWGVYPNSKGKADALRTWKRKGLDAIADRIIADVKARIVDDRDWIRGFIPHGSTYVNAEGWEDGIGAAASGTTAHDDLMAGVK